MIPLRRAALLAALPAFSQDGLEPALWHQRHSQAAVREKATNSTSLIRPKAVPWAVNLETKMASGTVKWFNPTKGYGFIQPTSGGKDVFVHISAVEQAGLSSLNEGQNVEYEIESNRGKESAVRLKVK
jgi:CspA family cold shock protein